MDGLTLSTMESKMITRKEALEAEIEELEEEQEHNDYGSYQYDVVDGELQYKYALLSKLNKGE